MVTGEIFELFPVTGWPDEMSEEDLAQCDRFLCALLGLRYVEDGD